jgi:hypothetical protein
MAAERSAHSGEAGLLAEEPVQRLLAIFAEHATACIGQIHTMSLQHGEAKYAALFELGLNLVQKWDDDVVCEEATRIEATYPEMPALHSYAFLWLADKLCGDAELAQLAVPPVTVILARFMKRVVTHTDVKRGAAFLQAPELARRLIFVDALRGAYHDALQRSGRALPTPVRLPRRAGADALVAPDEAASHVAARATDRWRDNADLASLVSRTPPLAATAAPAAAAEAAAASAASAASAAAAAAAAASAPSAPSAPSAASAASAAYAASAASATSAAPTSSATDCLQQAQAQAQTAPLAENASHEASPARKQRRGQNLAAAAMPAEAQLAPGEQHWHAHNSSEPADSLREAPSSAPEAVSAPRRHESAISAAVRAQATPLRANSALSRGESDKTRAVTVNSVCFFGDKA